MNINDIEMIIILYHNGMNATQIILPIYQTVHNTQIECGH